MFDTFVLKSDKNSSSETIVGIVFKVTEAVVNSFISFRCRDNHDDRKSQGYIHVSLLFRKTQGNKIIFS